MKIFVKSLNLQLKDYCKDNQITDYDNILETRMICAIKFYNKL